MKHIFVYFPFFLIFKVDKDDDLKLKSAKDTHELEEKIETLTSDLEKADKENKLLEKEVNIFF